MDFAEIFGLQTYAGGTQEVIQLTRRILTDETEHVIPSLELNRVAFWTYHEASIANGEDLCELVIEMLLSILSKPESYSPLTLQKTLAVTKHILIYGAEVVVNQAICLGRHVENLLTYNTILMAQKKQGLEGFFLQIKGGGVDRGGPVREMAASVHALLSDVSLLRLERSTKADPTSLVPVGNQKAGFVTDEVRLYALKKRMEHDQSMVTRSNLAKADGGFGGGYMSRDGKTHVGAAHGIEEMLRQAEREKQRFSDDALANRTRRQYDVDPTSFSEYVAPRTELLGQEARQGRSTASSTTVDLLSLEEPLAQSAAEEVDLLCMGGTSTDLLGTASLNTVEPPPLAATNFWDPIASSASAKTASSVTSDLLDFLPSDTSPSAGVATSNCPGVPSAQKKAPMETTTVDRFSALDDLIAGSTANSRGIATAGMTQSQATATATSSSFEALVTQSLSTLSLATPTTSVPVTPVIDPAATSLRISSMGEFRGSSVLEEEDLGGDFVMGGAPGTGVSEPLAPAPAAPPPPPPPSSAWMGL